MILLYISFEFDIEHIEIENLHLQTLSPDFQ